MAIPEQDELLEGQRSGEVFLDAFDVGVMTTLGGEVDSTETMYVIVDLPGVSAPPDFDGVPIYFSWPDEVLQDYILPSFMVRRDSITPAMSRWHQDFLEYRIPAPGADPSTVTHPLTGRVIAEGFNRYEVKAQAVPFDLLYTIQIRARYRNNLRVSAMKMLHYTLKKYQPYTSVFVTDSEGGLRGYTAFMEGPSAADTMSNVMDREIRFNVSLRVEAELDLNDPKVQQALTSLPEATVLLR